MSDPAQRRRYRSTCLFEAWIAVEVGTQGVAVKQTTLNRTRDQAISEMQVVVGALAVEASFAVMTGKATDVTSMLVRSSGTSEVPATPRAAICISRSTLPARRRIRFLRCQMRAPTSSKRPRRSARSRCCVRSADVGSRAVITRVRRVPDVVVPYVVRYRSMFVSSHASVTTPEKVSTIVPSGEMKNVVGVEVTS